MKLQQYILTEKLSAGSFGQLFKGHHEKTGELVAVKIEETRIKTLQHEATILHYLQKNKVRNIPLIYWYGEIAEIGVRAIIMPFYQYPLLEYIEKNGQNVQHGWQQKMNQWMMETIDILKEVHITWVLHRDIKPQNFMIHRGKTILIDFGLAVFHDTNQENIPRTQLIGTPNYASIRLHEGNQYCWRDDLISLGYVYLYLLEKGLAIYERWPNIKRTPEKEASIEINDPYNQSLLEKKQLGVLLGHCGENIPLCKYFKYVYSLKYGQIPNYDGMKKVFA
jgi:serine/threonine protein kinase